MRYPNVLPPLRYFVQLLRSHTQGLPQHEHLLVPLAPATVTVPVRARDDVRVLATTTATDTTTTTAAAAAKAKATTTAAKATAAASEAVSDDSDSDADSGAFDPSWPLIKYVRRSAERAGDAALLNDAAAARTFAVALDADLRAGWGEAREAMAAAADAAARVSEVELPRVCVEEEAGGDVRLWLEPPPLRQRSEHRINAECLVKLRSGYDETLARRSSGGSSGGGGSSAGVGGTSGVCVGIGGQDATTPAPASASASVSPSSSTFASTFEFEEALWLLLHRYATMFGPHSGEGRGWQLATPPGAMDAFGADFGVNVECFASPFNRR